MEKSLIIQKKLSESFDKHKGKSAIEYNGRKITYEKLDKNSSLIKKYLIQKEISDQENVGIICKNKVNLITAMIGALKAGCSIVPLEYSYPKERLINMVSSIDLKYIITDDNDDALIFDDMNISEIMNYMEIMSNESLSLSPDYDISYGEKDKIYVYFTSGSTGIPKAIMGMNKSLAHFIDWEINTFKIDDSFKISQFTNCSFDVFLRDIFVPLNAGACICIPNNFEELLASSGITEWINENKINLIHCVPSLFRFINNDLLRGDDYKNLKYVLLAGENIKPLELKKWYKVFDSKIQLVNLYGPTETTLAKFFYLIKKDDVTKNKIPVGKPINSTRGIILNEKMEPCEIMETGEVYIRTPYRSLGYFNDDKLNEEKFIKNPFNNNPKDIIYKTGDLGRVLLDGNIELMGRIDRQVKVRGIRIEPGEIENNLLEIEDIKEAVVATKENEGNKFLCAYIVMKDNSDDEMDIEIIKKRLMKKIPQYMVPDYIIKVNKIPLNLNGKADINLLPDPLDYRETMSNMELSGVEKELIKIWSKITNINEDNIDINRSFFEIGGNSLSIIQLSSLIHKSIKLKVSLTDILNNDNIRKLSSYIEGFSKSKYESIEVVEKSEYYKLSSAQKRMYFLQNMSLSSTSYNISVAFSVDGNIDKLKFENTLKKLILRHESLRTSFEIKNYEPVQIIHDNAECKVSYYEGDEENIKHIFNEFVKPFQLDKTPLFHIGLIRINDNKHILILDMHHIITDGVSMNILIRDFTRLYEGEKLKDLRIQYKDFARWQDDTENSIVMKEKENYWLNQFKIIPTKLELPRDFKEDVKLYECEENGVSFKLDSMIASLLKEKVALNKVSLYVYTLAIYNILLTKYCDKDDIVVGTAVACRTHADLENIMGMFVNMLAIRNFPMKDKIFQEFLREVNKNALKALENQEYQFDTLIRSLNMAKKLNTNPLFDTVFQVQNAGIEKFNLKELKLSLYENLMKKGMSRYELVLSIDEHDDDIYFNFQYCTSLYKKETIVEIWGNYVSIMKAILENEDILIRDIHLKYSDFKDKSNESKNHMLDIDFDFK